MLATARRHRDAEKQRDEGSGQRPKATLPSSLKLPVNEPDSNSPSGNPTRTFYTQQGPHQAGTGVAVIIVYDAVTFYICIGQPIPLNATF